MSVEMILLTVGRSYIIRVIDLYRFYETVAEGTLTVILNGISLIFL